MSNENAGLLPFLIGLGVVCYFFPPLFGFVLGGIGFWLVYAFVYIHAS
jgi:hypothetical protein